MMSMIYPGWCFHGRAGYFDACCSGIAVMLQRRLDAGIVESAVHNNAFTILVAFDKSMDSFTLTHIQHTILHFHTPTKNNYE